jgi:hypothetical protein
MANLEIDVAVLRQEVDHNKELIIRLVTTTDKMCEVSSDVARILAVHDERLLAAETATTNVATQLKERDMEHMEDIKTVNIRLGEVHTALSNELVHTEGRLMEKLDTIQTTAIIEKKDTDSRLKTLENWRWMLLGGGVVLGFVIGKIPVLSALFSIFPK